MRIVRLANFVAPRSGGLRTSLAELGAGYLAAGHEPVLVIPGERDGDELTTQGRVVTARVAGQRPRGTGTRRRGTGTGEPERLKQAFRKLAASRALALGSAQAAEPTITT